jgi:hypothetical protein
MPHGFEGSQVGATPIEEGVCHQTPHKKAFDDAERHPSRCRTPPPPRCVWGPITQTRQWTSFGTQGGPTSPKLAHLSGTERYRTPGMLLGSILPGSLMAEQQLGHHTRAPVRRKSHGDAAPAFISQLQGAPGGLQPGQATGAAGRTSLAAAKDRLVHGSAGRHQLATLPSSSLRGATFDGTRPSAAMLRGTLRRT